MGRKRVPAKRWSPSDSSAQREFDAAKARIGERVTDYLRWLIRFQNIDLSRLRAIDQRRLGWEVLAFSVGLGQMPGLPRLAPLALPGGPRPTKEIEAFQRTLKSGLRALFESESGTWILPYHGIKGLDLLRGTSEASLIRDEFGRPSVSKEVLIKKPPIYLQYHAQWPDSFWLAVANYLSVGGEWVRKCLVCGTVFGAVKRQEYCKPGCSQTVRTRRYRAHKRTKPGKKT